MPLCYSANTMGTFTLVQNGNKSKIQIRQGNCLAIFLNIYKEKEPQDPDKPWVHQLVSFFVNEQHIKNCKKDIKTNLFKKLFGGDLKNIRLNMYYKECETLLKYFIKDGYKVQCYYKENKK